MRARRVLVSAPVLLALALGGAPALAADDPDLFSGTRLEHRSERAAKGARLQKAGNRIEIVETGDRDVLADFESKFGQFEIDIHGHGVLAA